ncbi:MAG: hypothetical protein HKN48_01245, partial [Flavobacteriaceae bacterium]|nr:hypothetical protein [Flavobacteriaceae bacterium]
YEKENGDSGFWSETHELRREERMKEREIREEERAYRNAERLAQTKEREVEREERMKDIDRRRKNQQRRIEKQQERIKERNKQIAKRSYNLAKANSTRSIAKSIESNDEDVYFDSDDGYENAIIIDKDTSDETLATMKKNLEAKGITFNYSKVKRNSLGEIVRIKIVTSDGKGSKSTVVASADDGEPINDIIIEI